MFLSQCDHNDKNQRFCHGTNILLKNYTYFIILSVLFCFSHHTLLAGLIEDEGEKTIIHIQVHDWIFPDPSHTDTAIRSEAAKVKAFTKQFPHIFAKKYRAQYKEDPERYGSHNWDHVEVHVHNFSGLKIEGVESDLLAIAGKVAPDIIYVNFRKSATYIEQGFLYPLDKPEDHYLTHMTQEEIDFRVHPKIWPVIKRKGPGGKEYVWALPFRGALGKVLFYRKDLFDTAGVEYPNENWTWDDLYEACKKLTDPAQGIYGIRFVSGKQEAYHWVNFLWAIGADILRFNNTAERWEVAFDTPEAAVALDFYTQLNTEPWIDRHGHKRYGYVYKDPSDGYIKWERGEIAMKFDYVFERLISKSNPDLVGMVPAPKGPTGIRAAELNSRMMGLFAEIKEPAVRDAAWEFIQFYDSKEAVEVKTHVMVEGGLGQYVNPKYLRMFGYPELIRLFPKGWDKTFETAIETGQPEPYAKHSNIAYDILTKPLQETEQLALQDKLPKEREARLAYLLKLLKKTGNKAREEMLEEFPPEVVQKRKFSAAVFIALVLIAFTILFRKVVKDFAPHTPEENKPTWNLRRHAWAYTLLLPAIITIAIWQYAPLLRGSIMGFQDYKIMGNSTWVGIQHFGNVLWNPDWWLSVWNSARYCVWVVVFTFLPPVILAIFLQEIPRGTLLFRTIYYLPAVMCSLVVILLWKSFYDPSERGVLNGMLMSIPAIVFIGVGFLSFFIAFTFFRRLHYHQVNGVAWLSLAIGLCACFACFELAKPMLTQTDLPFLKRLWTPLSDPYRWLQDPKTAMLACVIPIAWAGLGPSCLIYLAALKGISNEFYEAADMDGATFSDKILFIVFPILKPLLIINFVGVFVGSWFYSEANILAMTGGAAQTEVAGLHIFYKAFIFHQFGPATAMAWILAFMLIGCTVYQLRILSRLEFRGSSY